VCYSAMQHMRSTSICSLLKMRLHVYLSMLITEDEVAHALGLIAVYVLKCVTMCCSALQCVAVCCSVLQCVAVCCSVLQ